MKKLGLFSLVFVLCVAMDADAFFFRHFHHNRSAIPHLQGIPYTPAPQWSMPPAGTPTPSVLAPSLQVPREVGDRINRTSELLRETRSILEPLLKTHKIPSDTGSTSTTPATGAGNRPPGRPIPFSQMSPEEQADFLRRLNPSGK